MIRSYVQFFFTWIPAPFIHRLLFATWLLQGENFKWQDVAELVGTGLRFDAMVAGYLSAVLLIFIAPTVFGSLHLTQTGRRLLRLYCLVAAGALTTLTSLDFAWFLQTGTRINSAWIQAQAVPLPWSSVEGVIMVMVLMIILALQLRWQWRCLTTFPEINWIRWTACAVLTAVVIRGSFGEQHLDLRFAQVTNSAKINLLIVPTAYAWDQALRERW